MSDLAATNCGNVCGCNNERGNGSNCLWLILILLFCGNNDGCGCGDNNCLWIILLLLFCGGSNNICGNNGCSCGCGCF
ncbi:MAG: chorion class high-cysteine HCB protein 13 [Lachnospiraceae bacterium]|nr:chorion class high-cysteine HCB protein 13 [Lachnospiraceae bacterium]